MEQKTITLKRKRTMKYFITSTMQVMAADGISGVTIRKVADTAGYNSATIYNYFENLDELVSLALLDTVIPYFRRLFKLLNTQNKSYVTFLLTWREYALHSFADPEIYNYVFYSQHSSEVLGYIDYYLHIFPSEEFEKDNELASHILGTSIKQRDDLIIDPCIADGYVKQSDKQYIMDYCYALQIGMSFQIRELNVGDAKTMAKRYLDYVIDFLLHHSTIISTKSNLLDYIVHYPNASID